ncbi:hypothetical protein PVK06_016782 [Gossypium arboreum]|uniref:Uncharacterized protein n=1 Tax=Gossypium arboreum TaxID=29729 RepID=A0ABR0Q214_GOSAR|nr:hypothetical protein PVK06_016782 [Gossypium arboreum]
MESDGKRNHEDQSSGTLDESSASLGAVFAHETKVAMVTPADRGSNLEIAIDSLTHYDWVVDCLCGILMLVR